MKTLFRIFLLCFITTCAVPYHAVREEQNYIPLEPAVTVTEEPIITQAVHASSSHKIVLVTIDGVRWQDIFNGTDRHMLGRKIQPESLLPNLYTNFVYNGTVIGKDSLFVASGPAHISLPGYLEIMRGHPSHDCTANDCEPKLTTTVVDMFDNAAVFTSWDVIRKAVSNNKDKYVVNCGRDYRSEGWKKLGLVDNTTFPTAWSPEYRPDLETQKAVREYLKANGTPQFLWVALGDTDEWAHAGHYPEYILSLEVADQFVGELIKLYDSDTTFIVTADHGRSNNWTSHGWDAESARDWIMMTGKDVPNQGFVKLNQTKSLSNIFPTIQSLVTGKKETGSLL
jgi:hypothetical protein